MILCGYFGDKLSANAIPTKFSTPSFSQSRSSAEVSRYGKLQISRSFSSYSPHDASPKEKQKKVKQSSFDGRLALKDKKVQSSSQHGFFKVRSCDDGARSEILGHRQTPALVRNCLEQSVDGRM